MAGILDWLRGMFDRFFIPESLRFTRITISESVLADVMDFAKASHPHEFVASLDGKVIEGVLHVTGLLYQPFKASDRSAVLDIIDLPMTASVVGSVHSHPSAGYMPSGADRAFFRKRGVIHLIIKFPYAKDDIMCYDDSGMPCDYE